MMKTNCVACDLTAQLTVTLLSPEGRMVEEALLELQKTNVGLFSRDLDSLFTQSNL
jgi:hypothetical protein